MCIKPVQIFLFSNKKGWTISCFILFTSYFPPIVSIVGETFGLIIFSFFQFAQNLIFGSPFCPVRNASPAVVSILNQWKLLYFLYSLWMWLVFLTGFDQIMHFISGLKAISICGSTNLSRPQRHHFYNVFPKNVFHSTKLSDLVNYFRGFSNNNNFLHLCGFV